MRALLAFALGCLPAFGNAQRQVPRDFDAIVEERLAQSEGPACIAVGLVGDHTQVKFGCTEGAGPAKLDERSLFEIGSITKGFTGLLLADMARKGEVSLDDPAAKYARPGAKLPRRGSQPITLRDLVTHASGLPRLPPGMNPNNPRDPYADLDEDTLYAALARTPDGSASPKYEYSNFGFMWLGELLARRAGKSYEVLLRERVLAPLGMKETTLALDAAQRERFVNGHDVLYREAPHWNFVPNLAGVGGLRSSLGDMLKMARALAGREDTPLKETIALALAPLRPSAGDNSVGHGWFTNQRRGTRVHWHNGGTGGFTSMIAVDPAARTAAVVLVDSAVNFDDLALHLVDPSTVMAKKRTKLATAPEVLKQYAGRYQLAPAFAIEVFVEGEALMAQATGQDALQVYREGDDVFFYTVVAAKLRFSRGADGQVEAVTLEQNGREVKGKRVPSTR